MVIFGRMKNEVERALLPFMCSANFSDRYLNTIERRSHVEGSRRMAQNNQGNPGQQNQGGQQGGGQQGGGGGQRQDQQNQDNPNRQNQEPGRQGGQDRDEQNNRR